MTTRCLMGVVVPVPLLALVSTERERARIATRIDAAASRVHCLTFFISILSFFIDSLRIRTHKCLRRKGIFMPRRGMCRARFGEISTGVVLAANEGPIKFAAENCEQSVTVG